MTEGPPQPERPSSRLAEQIEAQARAQAAARDARRPPLADGRPAVVALPRPKRSGSPIALRIMAGILAVGFLAQSFSGDGRLRTTMFGVMVLLYAVGADVLLRKLFPGWMKPIGKQPPPAPPPPPLPPAETVRKRRDRQPPNES